jgi:riboflavin kinase/FMN adenylyltransferase
LASSIVTRIIPLSELSESTDLQSFVSGGVVSIGNFDGVHRGHAALLTQTRKLADKLSGPAVAVVLDPHPAAILRPDKTPPRLTWIERRAELMSPFGIDALVVCETTPKFLSLTAQEFFDVLIVGQLDAEAMVEGPNFFFGRDRGGNVQLLTSLCDRHGIEIQIVKPTAVGAEMISSTRIRRLISGGDIAAANQLLGTNYQIRGTVVTGVGRGRQIGFPTANLAAIDVLIPAVGVYAGLAQIDGQSRPAAIHIGPNPTFDDDQQVKVEVHLIDEGGDFYGRPLLVDFVDRVRDIARFDSPMDLIAQLRRDIQSVLTILQTTESRPHGR